MDLYVISDYAGESFQKNRFLNGKIDNILKTKL